MARTKRKGAASPEPGPGPAEHRQWKGTPDLEAHLVPVGDLNPDPANVRKHPERNILGIRSSLARFGQQRAILIDADGIIRAGNGTYAAALELGWTHIAAARTDLRGTEATAYAIADNNLALSSEWDDEGLASTLRALQSEDFDLAAVGFTDDEVDALCESLGDALVPDFQPASEDEQGRLDEKAKVECPECGHRFAP